MKHLPRILLISKQRTCALALVAALLSLCTPAETLLAASTPSQTGEYFAATAYPPLPSGSAPTLIWRDAAGLTAGAEGAFFRLESGSDTWVAVAAENADIPSNAWTATGDGRVFLVEGTSITSFS